MCQGVSPCAKAFHPVTLLHMATPVFEGLLELAVDQHGYVRVKDAAAHGIHGASLRRLARGGRLEHVAHGLYRVPVLPRERNAQYAEATLWAGGRGVVSHSSALALHELCDVNPARLHITVPASYAPRRAGGELYRVWRRNLPEGDVTTVDGIAVVTPARAVADALEVGEDPRMIEQAIKTGRARGDLTASDATGLRAALRLRLRRPHRRVEARQ